VSPFVEYLARINVQEHPQLFLASEMHSFHFNQQLMRVRMHRVLQCLSCKIQRTEDITVLVFCFHFHFKRYVWQKQVFAGRNPALTLAVC